MRSLGAYFVPSELGLDFRRIFPAAIISNLGDGALLAAGPLLVASITTEPAAVGAAAFVQQLPWRWAGSWRSSTDWLRRSPSPSSRW